MDIVINIAVFIVGGVFGYRFCKMRYRVDDLLMLIGLYADHMSGKITITYFVQKFKEKFGDLK